MTMPIYYGFYNMDVQMGRTKGHALDTWCPTKQTEQTSLQQD
jgi:hypothetical protein